MTSARILAVGPVLALTALAMALGGGGIVPWREVWPVVASVAAGFGPSAWLAPGGWRRRAAEASLLVVAFALTFIADPTMRQMVLPPLLAAGAAVASGVAVGRLGGVRRMVVVAAFVLALRCATAATLVGGSWWSSLLALIVPVVLACALGRGGDPVVAMAGGAVAALAPLSRLPQVALALLGLGVLALVVSRPSSWGRAARPALLVVAPLLPVAAALAPWGGMPATHAAPAASWPLALTFVALLVASSRLPPAFTGAGCLAASLLLGPVLGPPPDVGALELTAANPSATLATGTGTTYRVETALANGADIAQGAVVATLMLGPRSVELVAGQDAAEWAHERPDVRAHASHSLPARPVWRPAGRGRDSFWGVAGRTDVEVTAGVRPRIERAAGLADSVVVVVASAGPARPSSRRSWPALGWLLAGAVAIAVVQLVGLLMVGHRPSATAWLALSVLSVALRLPVEPLGVLAERHAVDLVLLALMLAWWPMARACLRSGRVFVAAAALLVPLAIGAAALGPPGIDERYHLILASSIVADQDLAIDNNLDLDATPANQVFAGQALIHSPVLAFVLLPGFVAAGRFGALAILALLGAALVAVTLRLADRVGVPRSRQSVLFGALLLTHPLATFSTQVWVEVPGALLSALALLAVLSTPPRWLGASAAGLVAIVMKTRLALPALAPAAFALLPLGRRRDPRLLLRAVALVAAAAIGGLLLADAIYGHPLGPLRRVGHLMPRSARHALLAWGGLLLDPAGGLLFAAPLLGVGLVGLVRLWRRGLPAARGLVVAFAATVFLLGASPEWYGGGCPPARYLVPFTPLLALGLGLVLSTPSRLRPLVTLTLPLAALAAWAFATRPYLAYNPGDGGWWLTTALARRLAADTRYLIPSFLRPAPATWLLPLALAVLASAAVVAARSAPRALRWVGRSSITAALLLAAGAVAWTVTRVDRTVEVEDAQVSRRGGTLQPPLGTFSRFLEPNGWRVGNGDGVIVPLRVTPASRLRVDGWHDGAADEVLLLSGWDGAEPRPAGAVGVPNGVLIPSPPAGGRHRLQLVLEAPPGVTAVLDRIRIEEHPAPESPQSPLTTP